MNANTFLKLYFKHKAQQKIIGRLGHFGPRSLQNRAMKMAIKPPNIRQLNRILGYTFENHPNRIPAAIYKKYPHLHPSVKRLGKFIHKKKLNKYRTQHKSKMSSIIAHFVYSPGGVGYKKLVNKYN